MNKLLKASSGNKARSEKSCSEAYQTLLWKMKVPEESALQPEGGFGATYI